MSCGKTIHWTVSLVTVTTILISAGLCTAQGRADTNNYIVELNKLGIAGRPEIDNAAPFYEKAVELYVQMPTALKDSERTWSKKIPPQEKDSLRKWLQDNNAALEQVQLGSQKPYCWFTQTEQISQATSLRSARIDELAIALSLRAMLQAEEGNVSSAISDIETLYKCGAHNEAGPRLLNEKMMGISIKSMAVTVVLNILSETTVNADMMKGLQEQLEQLCPKQNEPFDIRGERIYMQGQIETDPKAAPFKPYLQSALEYYNTMSTKTPWQLHTERVPAPPSDKLLLTTDMTQIIEIEYRSRADTQALITTLAVLRYKSDKGGYPSALPELVSAGYIKEQPIDPFSNNPLVYKQAQDNFTLYSFGTDYDDDGGQYSNWGRDEQGGDQVFWPVQAAASEARQVADLSGRLLTERQPQRQSLPGPEQEKLNEALHMAIIAGETNRIESILANGADINGKNRQSWTPLHNAIFYGTQDMVELLISKGANVNAQDDQGNTPLHFATIKGNTDAANLLINKGANINAKTQSEQTALFVAADNGRKDIVELLISKGADVNAQAGPENALSIARRKGNNEIMDLLLKHGATEPAQDLTGEGLYVRRGQTEGLTTSRPGAPELYPGNEGQGQSAGRIASSRTGEEILADANEIKARVRTYEGLETALQEIESKSRTEKGAWLQRNIDNRTSLLRFVDEQVKLEMTLVRNIATEEKAEKTIKTIDDVLLKRQELTGLVRKELLVQRRDQRETQNVRGRGSSTSRTTRGGRGSQEEYTQGQQQPWQDMTRREGRGTRDEGEQLDSETQNRVNQWLQATLDNKENLLRSVYTDARTQYASIRAVAVEEEAKKTTAAIDGILLNREMRINDAVTRMEGLAEKEAQQEEGRGRGAGRTTTRSSAASGRGQTGQEQPVDDSSSRSRRR